MADQQSSANNQWVENYLDALVSLTPVPFFVEDAGCHQTQLGLESCSGLSSTGPGAVKIVATRLVVGPSRVWALSLADWLLHP